MNDLDIIDNPYMIDLVFMQDISKKDFIKSIERDGVILWVDLMKEKKTIKTH